MQLTILGCGSSAGTPAIGCGCDTCISENIKNKRTRCSSLVSFDTGENILIDSGPDLRIQALREGFSSVDAVLYTHTHADHLHGIDDLRAFCIINRKQIPIYARLDAIEHIQSKFGYAIREPGQFWEMPVLSAHAIASPFELFGTTVTPIPVMHGKITIHGYRIGKMAYLTDVSEIPEHSFPLLEGLDVLLIDCLRTKPHPTHISVEQSLSLIERIGAKQSVLIHMTHELEYAALSELIPANVKVGFDGLKLKFNQ
jgi:phosphoribosyl 1,2-cyclic phosphate phosphodiesterase